MWMGAKYVKKVFLDRAGTRVIPSTILPKRWVIKNGFSNFHTHRMQLLNSTVSIILVALFTINDLQ